MARFREAQGNAAGRGIFLEAQGTEGQGASAFRVRIVEAGLSGNRNYYPAAVLRASAPRFEGARVFVKGDQEHLKGQGKDFRNLIGCISDVSFQEANGGSLEGVLKLLEPSGPVAVKLREAWDRGMTSLFGLSMDADGEAVNDKINGQAVKRAVAIHKVDSVDLIVEPGAGGAIINFIEAKKDDDMKMREAQDDENKTADAGQPDSAAPDAANDDAASEINIWRTQLIALIQALAPALLEGVDVDAISDEALKELSEKATEAGQKEAEKEEGKAGDDPAAVTAQEFAEAVADTRMIETRMAMREAVNASTLPQAAKDKLIKQFKGYRSFTRANVETAIAEERAYLAKFSESGAVRGLGGSGIFMGKTHGEKTAERLDAFFDPKHKNHRECRSFKEAYIDITGDTRVTGHIRNCDQARLREALDSESWDVVLGDSITRRMVALYNMKSALDAWRKFVIITPSNDFRIQQRTRVGGYGDLPKVPEKGNYNPLGTPDDEKAEFAVEKRGGTESVTLEAIKNDDMQAISRIPVNLSRAASRTVSRFAFSFIKDNPAIYDGKALFCAEHKNLGTAPLNDGAFAAARLAMMKQTEPGSNEYLSCGPRFLAVPFELEQAAFDMFRRDTNHDETFEQSLHPECISVWCFTDPNDWVAIADPMDIPTIEISFLDGEEEPSLFVQDSPTSGSLFNNDTITYKIRHIYGGNVLDFRGFFKSMVP